MTKSNRAIESIHTDLRAGACKEETDKSDPNDTPYYRCPGVAGYTLILRRVDSGRQSIDVIDPKKHAHPLEFEEFVTRHMFGHSDKAEWRLQVKDGKRVPIALIVRVEAHEDSDDPSQVTHAYWVVSKITPNKSCVTDRILESKQSAEQVRRTADSALARPCAAPQPQMMTDDGEVIR